MAGEEYRLRLRHVPGKGERGERGGIDEPDLEVIAENSFYIVLKVPGHMARFRIGERTYHSPEVIVFEKVEGSYKETDYGRCMKVVELISWENKRKKKE